MLTVILLQGYLTRPYWYDEAITLMEFVGQEGFLYIYNNYQIPNNHIAYNCLLMGWIRCWQHVMPITETGFRALSVLLAGISVWIVACRWKLRLGPVALPVAMSLSLSLPMLIYGTAIRGYMLSFLLVLVGIGSAVRWRDQGSIPALVVYGLSAFFAIGTMPSNLIAYAAINLLPDKPLTNRNLLTPRRLALAVVPVLAFALFYLPIAGKLFGALSLKEGWQSSAEALRHVYGAFAVNMFPVVLLAAAGMVLRAGRIWRDKWALTNAAGAWLIPAIMMVVIDPAPFPRAFFCFWPVWLYLICLSGKHSLSFVRERHGRATCRQAIGIMILLSAAWGVLMQTKPELPAAICTPQCKQDDFCMPYFMLPGFDPEPVARASKSLLEESYPKVFISSATDFPGILIYGKIIGIPEDAWLYDRPGNKVMQKDIPAVLPVIAASSDDADSIAKRFKFKSSTFVEDFGSYKIYIIKLTNHPNAGR